MVVLCGPHIQPDDKLISCGDAFHIHILYCIMCIIFFNILWSSHSSYVDRFFAASTAYIIDCVIAAHKNVHGKNIQRSMKQLRLFSPISCVKSVCVFLRGCVCCVCVCLCWKWYWSVQPFHLIFYFVALRVVVRTCELDAEMKDREKMQIK